MRAYPVEQLTQQDLARLRELEVIEGSGQKFLGFSKADENGLQYATRWLTIFHMPIAPMSRYYLQLDDAGYDEQLAGVGIFDSGTSTRWQNYRIYGKTRLSPVEILLTYISRWILVPALYLMPIYIYAALGENSITSSFWGFLGLAAWWGLLTLILKYVVTEYPYFRSRPR